MKTYDNREKKKARTKFWKTATFNDRIWDYKYSENLNKFYGFKFFNFNIIRGTDMYQGLCEVPLLQERIAITSGLNLFASFFKG